jgi:hypothetical protein
MGCHGAQLLHMLRQDEDAWKQWQKHVVKILKTKNPYQMHWELRKCLGMTFFEAMVNAAQFLFLQSLVARTMLDVAASIENSGSTKRGTHLLQKV